MSSEVSTLSRLRIRNTLPRWARTVRQMIQKKKKTEEKEKPVIREGGETAHTDAELLEEKAVNEKENVERKSKLKVILFRKNCFYSSNYYNKTFNFPFQLCNLFCSKQQQSKTAR